MSGDDIESIKFKEIKVLGNGFIRLIDYMGSDQAIVDAARISYGEGTKRKRQDEGLLRYLMKHQHMTPFEMCEIKLHVKLPIFVARQWVRHRTANINEYSARYSVLDEDFYLPEIGEISQQSTKNKQGRRDTPLDFTDARKIRDEIEKHSLTAYRLYEELLQTGIARELSRMVLPLNFYTQWYWKVDLRNLMNFLLLRMDVHAQYEIRVYAKAIFEKILQIWVPMTSRAFSDYMLKAQTLSHPEQEFLCDYISDIESANKQKQAFAYDASEPPQTSPPSSHNANEKSQSSPSFAHNASEKPQTSPPSSRNASEPPQSLPFSSHNASESPQTSPSSRNVHEPPQSSPSSSHNASEKSQTSPPSSHNTSEPSQSSPPSSHNTNEKSQTSPSFAHNTSEPPQTSPPSSHNANEPPQSLPSSSHNASESPQTSLSSSHNANEPPQTLRQRLKSSKLSPREQKRIYDLFINHKNS